MAIYDVTEHRIIVILNTEYFSKGTSIHPLDAEGVVLSIQTRTQYADDMYYDGHVLELLCDPNTDPENGWAIVRWPNDKRGMINFGEMILRRSRISRCRSIWDEYHNSIWEDFRAIDELKPNFGGQNIRHPHKYNNPPIANEFKGLMYKYESKPSKKNKYTNTYSNPAPNPFVTEVTMETMSDIFKTMISVPDPFSEFQKSIVINTDIASTIKLDLESTTKPRSFTDEEDFWDDNDDYEHL